MTSEPSPRINPAPQLKNRQPFERDRKTWHSPQTIEARTSSSVNRRTSKRTSDDGSLIGISNAATFTGLICGRQLRTQLPESVTDAQCRTKVMSRIVEQLFQSSFAGQFAVYARGEYVSLLCGFASIHEGCRVCGKQPV